MVGQGYVGLSLALAAAGAGFRVIGYDIDGERIADLAAGRLVVPGVDEQAFGEGTATGRLSFTTDTARLGEADVICICVPTPVADHSPDLSYVRQAATTVGTVLRTGALVVLESTTYPGTTEELVAPLLEQGGLVAGRDFLLAYSPERVDPGNAAWGLRNTPRVVGGATPEATEAAVVFYSRFVDKVVAVSTTRVAETAKLLENTFRHVNIALVNELAMLCHEIGIDTWEVIDAAATKSFGYMPFYPGPGVGGHCIPLDPTYLAWQFRRAGRRFGVLEQAQEVNEGMPAYVASRVGSILNDVGRAVKGANILVMGVTYKPDVGDTRESPALAAMQALRRRGADVRFHDVFIDEVPLDGDTVRRVDDLRGAIADADLVVLLTPHTGYDLDELAANARLIFDTRNAFSEDRRPNVVPL